RSFALGRVVTICSCLISAADILANIALRWEAVRLNLRPRLPCRMGYLLKVFSGAGSIMIFVALSEVIDVLGGPIVDVHSEMKPHLCQDFLDFIERLAAEVRRPQHLGFRLLDKVA